MELLAYLLPELFIRTPYYSFSWYDHGRLPGVLADLNFRNALWLASPGFYAVLEKKGFDSLMLNEKELFTLKKYLNRMCFRPTPFGSFAAFTVASRSQNSVGYSVKGEAEILHILPDQAFRNGVIKQLDLHDGLIKLNPTLYRLGKELRFIKSLPDSTGKYRFTLAAVAADRFNVQLIALFHKGKISAGRLQHWISSNSLCTEHEAREYMEFLLEEQVLYSASHGHLVQGQQSLWHELLPVSLLDAHGVLPFSKGVPLPEMQQKVIAATGAPVSPAPDAVFYGALERRIDFIDVEQDDWEQLITALTVLRSLARPVRQPALLDFISAFTARFDRQKVPLLLTLDPDAGISYGTTGGYQAEAGVLADLKFTAPEDAGRKMEWTPVHTMLTRLWQRGSRREHDPVIIEKEDLAELAPPETPGIPPSMGFMFRKTADHLVIDNAAGVTAASLIGRFSAFNDQVHQLCRDIAALESSTNPDVVFADIGQLSTLHTDNINLRKQIYPYEIPLNVYSALPESKQLKPEDLLLSVQNGELILESARLKKRVIPRLATAFNHLHNDLPLFRLLCDMQYQGVLPELTFSLDNFFPGLACYPRVQFENTIIARAKWTFKADELLAALMAPSNSLNHNIRQFRRLHRLPQWVSTGNADQQLVFDLTDKEEQQFFLQSIRGQAAVTITEFLLPDRSVKIAGRPFLAQFVGFLINDQVVYKAGQDNGVLSLEKAGRSHSLGGEWLYLKLYCTPQSADKILTDIVLPFIRSSGKKIISWFFIRYNDDGYHLRLRLFLRSVDLGDLIVSFNRKLARAISRHLISRYAADTYHRELERYRIAPIEEVETLFCKGSVLITVFLAHQIPELVDDFQLGLLTAHLMIKTFLMSDENPLLFTAAVRERFLLEFNAGKETQAIMDSKYRAMKAVVENLILYTGPEISQRSEFRDLTLQLKNIAGIVSAKDNADRHRLLADLVHMQMNRTFQADQRRHELLIYYFLHKFYKGMLARTKRSI